MSPSPTSSLTWWAWPGADTPGDFRPYGHAASSVLNGLMKLLLIESVPGQAHEIRDNLVAEGHEVVTCHDDHGGPCRGADHHDSCPLEEHVDLAIVTRTEGSERTLHEMGGVCAHRHRVPSIEVDPANLVDELPSVGVASALATRKVDAGYAMAVRQELGEMPALVHVDRHVDRIHVTVQLPASLATPSKVSHAADRARAAVRRHDPYSSVVDISVTTYPDPD